MILFIWDSIHKPHVDSDITVNNNFMFNGIFIVFKLFRDVVISRMLKIDVFMYVFVIRFMGSVLKNIIVPRIVIRLLIFFVILFIIVVNMLAFLLVDSMVFFGFIISISIMLDKMFNNINKIAVLLLKMLFK